MKKRRYPSLLWSLVFFVSVHIGFAQETTYDQKVKKMIEVSGAKKKFEVAILRMIAIQRKTYGDFLGNDFFTVFEQEVLTRGFEELEPQLIPVYKKYLTEDQVTALIAFYESDAGKALMEKTPMMMQDAMTVGEVWGQKLGAQIIALLHEKNEKDFAKEIKEDCSRFREGAFDVVTQSGHSYAITRKGTIQKEISEGIAMAYRIKWLTNHRYELIPLDAEKKEISDAKIDVTIYEVEGDSYNYISRLKGSFLYDRGKVTLSK